MNTTRVCRICHGPLEPTQDMWCLKCIMGDTLDDRDDQNQKEEAQSALEIEARDDSGLL